MKPNSLFSLLSLMLYGIFSINLLASNGCLASKDNFFDDRERGWFWSEKDCEVKKENNTTVQLSQETPPPRSKYKLVPKVVDIPWDIIDQIDPSVIGEIERDAQKTAMMYPTDYNVKQHRLLQRYAMKKAFNYTMAADMLGKKDTDLSQWRSEVPTSAFARNATAQIASKKTNEIFKQYASLAGIVVITQKGCEYCEKQMPILEMFSKQTGFKYKEVDMHQMPTAVSRLGVAKTPDMFLVLNRNGKAEWQRIGSGLNTLPEVQEGVLSALYGFGVLKDRSLIYQ